MQLTLHFPGLNTTSVPTPVSSHVTQPRSSSQPPPGSKSVHFDPVSSSSPSAPRNPGGSNTRGHPSGEEVSPSYNGSNKQHSSLSNNDRPSRQYHHRRRASQNDVERSPSPAPSDTTVDLPPRFDQYGQRRPEKGEDPLADTLEELLSGSGLAGKLFNTLTGVLGLSDGDGARRRRR